MDYREAWQRLLAAQRILVGTHIKPDGDGLGAIAALAEVLTARGKQLRVILPSLPPDKYSFLPGAERFEVIGRDLTAEAIAAGGPADPLGLWDLLLIIDTCTWEQLAALAPTVRRHNGRVLVIDHHATRNDLGHDELSDPQAAAAGQIVLRLLQANGVPLTPSMAVALFVALATDTGWFRFPNVTPEVLRMAAQLQEAGARPSVLYERLYQRDSLAKLKLIQEALATLTVCPEGDVACFWLTRDMFRRTGAKQRDTENVIDECQRLETVIVGLLFVEQENGEIRVGLRSKRQVDVAEVAARFGGGGHARAAGCTVRGTMAEAQRRILDAVYRAMGRAGYAGPVAPVQQT